MEWIAHRGAPRERVENTLEGFRVALDRGADGVELDVHCTADGVVVVHHDFDVRGQPLAETAWADVSRLELGGGARIPTLEAVLLAVGTRATVYIELKGRGIEAAALAVAARHGRRYAFHSFDHDTIARLAGLAPDSRRGILLDRGVRDAAHLMTASVRRTGARDVWPHWTLVDAPFVAAARGLGMRVIAWTVNSADTARALADLGVDGICTDDVRLADPLD